MDNISLTGGAVAQASGAGQAPHSNPVSPQAEAQKPQEVTAIPTPSDAAGVPTGGSDESELMRVRRKGESLGEYMADAPIVADAPDEPVLQSKLSPGQASVLREMMAGKSVAAASKVTRVSRSTIYRWQSEDPQFIAALNAWKRQTDESIRNRLLALGDRAVTALNNALLTCDAKTAMSVLKGLGMLSPAKHGSPDVKVVEEELKLSRMEAETQIKEQQRAKKDRLEKAIRGW